MSKVKLTVIATLLFLGLMSLPNHAKGLTSNEYKAVVDTAYNYFNAMANGDQQLFSKAFDLDFGHVKMITTNKDTGKESIRSLTLQEFSGFFKKKTEDTWHGKVLSVDIVDDKMAMVKLDFKTSKSHYIDYLVMYKRDNNWRIINKTFVSK